MQAQKEGLNEDIHMEELQEAFRDMAREKCPEPGGLLVEYFKASSAPLLLAQLETFRETRTNKVLPFHKQEALIIMLFKPGNNTCSCRLQSMRNVDIKLLTNVFALRLG
ncbi:hypothetical protein NDU88_004049 [Pleurodeles waltl]|uniref:Uncharacterized protein n=1 Tax=Pleurodeles waltl TaxID=8319 RepID=A0AAV7UG26_PLEWA|nr:hypothetical protein NDU88_004049 [Pleurodeles waltl]